MIAIPASVIGIAKITIALPGVTAAPDGLRALLLKPIMAKRILITISDDPKMVSP